MTSFVWDEDPLESDDGDIMTDNKYGGAPDECYNHWPMKWNQCPCNNPTMETEKRND